MSQPLLQNLRQLAQLQQFDQQTDSLRHRCQQIPKEIEQGQQTVAHLALECEQKQNAIAALQQQLKALELKRQQSGEQLQKYEQRLSTVRTNEEHQAMLKQIDHAKKTRAEAEEAASTLEETLKQSENELQQSQAELAKVQTHAETKEKQLQQELQSAQSYLLTEGGMREELLKQVQDSSLLQTYNKLRSRSPLALVTLEKAFCHGCHMTLTTQLFNQVMRLQQFHQCPNCFRILFWQPPPPDTTLQTEKEAS